MGSGITREDSMMFRGQTPWHGLGNEVIDAVNCEEAIQQSGLGWIVKEVPLYAHLDYSEVNLDGEGPVFIQGTDEIAVDHKAIMRGDTKRILGVVGPDYTCVQNADAFKFFNPLVEQGLAVLETAGSLHQGRTIWILARIGERRMITGDDAVQQYLLLSTGHDGRRSVQVQPSTIRVVCANTLSMSDGAASSVKSMVKLAHTSGVQKRLDDLSAVIAPVLHSFDESVSLFQAMARRQTTSEILDAYLGTLFPDPVKVEDGKIITLNPTRAKNVREEIRQIYDGGLIGFDALGVNDRGSVWTMYNAVTEYVDHSRGRTQDTRLESAWFGPGKDLKVRARDLAAALVRSA